MDVDKLLELGLLAKGILPEDLEEIEEALREEPKPPIQEVYFKCSAQLFKNFLRLLNTINEEIVFKATPESLEINQTNPSLISLLKAKIDPYYCFTEYSCGGQTTLTLPVKRILSILPSRLKDYEIAFKYPLDGDINTSQLTLITPTGQAYHYKLTMPETTDYRDFKMAVEWHGLAKINLRFLYELLKQSKNLDIEWNAWRIPLEIELTPQYIRFVTKGEAGEIEQTLTREDPNLYAISASCDGLKSKVDVKQLLPFVQNALRLTDEAEIHLSIPHPHPKPIKVILPTALGNIEYYLAPIYEG